MRKFLKRNRVVTSGVDVQWDIDLAYVENLPQYDDGVKFLLVWVDVFSKYLFIHAW